MNPIRVARRALILSAVVCRASIDGHSNQTEVQVLCSRLLKWMTELDLWSEVEPEEEKWLYSLLGSMEPQDILRATWYVEGLAILAWALGQMEFPVHDRQVDPPRVAESLWFLSEDAHHLIQVAQLRTPVEIEAAREVLYATHCRLRNFIRHGEGRNISHWIDQTWVETLRLELAHLFVQDDLAIDDEPIGEVKNERVLECAHILFERHRAILWLTEDYLIYSQTLVDT